MSSAPRWSYACTRVNSSSEERRIRSLPRRSPLVLYALSVPVRISRLYGLLGNRQVLRDIEGRVARLQLHSSYSPAAGLTVPDGSRTRHGPDDRMHTDGRAHVIRSRNPPEAPVDRLAVHQLLSARFLADGGGVGNEAYAKHLDAATWRW